MEWIKSSAHLILSGLLVFMPGTILIQKDMQAIRPARIAKSVGCSPISIKNRTARENKNPWIPIFPGWGNYHRPSSTKNDSAAIYFDQGLSMYYSYHSKEAFLSFEMASRFDSRQAIFFWGEALAFGPSYNGEDYAMPQRMPGILASMLSRKALASEKEKDLISAMEQRYAKGGDAGQRSVLNRRYAAAMKELIVKYPEDPDVKALYVDAVMLEHRWDFWFNDGNPKEWTPELIEICEALLKSNPNHPGAMHYYIHLTEASRQPQKAIFQAGQLKELMPGVAHMVHMASHVYERTGYFWEGVTVNDQADEDLNRYDSLAPEISLPTKISHYYAVQAFCAINGGLYRESMPKVFRCRASVSPTKNDPDDQYLYMFPMLAWLRMGKWQDILHSPDPDPEWSYARILNDFAKGIANLRLGNIDSAIVFLHRIAIPMRDPILTVRHMPFSAPIQAASVAENILHAEIFAFQNNQDSAERYYQLAIETEDGLTYSEPKDWLIPARQFFRKKPFKMGQARTGRKSLSGRPCQESRKWMVFAGLVTNQPVT